MNAAFVQYGFICIGCIHYVSAMDGVVCAVLMVCTMSHSALCRATSDPARNPRYIIKALNVIRVSL